jgi:glycerol uptake facilitator-like aquaporin
MLGSICGATLLHLGTFGSTEGLTPRDFTGGLGANGINPRYSLVNAFVNETMMTFLLLFVVFETAVNKKSIAKNNAPIAIGFAVFLAHLVCIPITGCSINPTRSFGPAVVASLNGNSAVWNDHWVFWVAPMLGAFLAATLRGRRVVEQNHKD